MTLPLWISQDQADRLKAALEAEGFTDVLIEETDHSAQLGVCASSGGAPHAIRVSEPTGLTNVVWRFKKWRDHRNG